MKKFVFLLVFVFLSTSVFANTAPIRLAYSTTESAPYQLGTGYEISNPPGVSVEIIQQAATNLGLTIVLERLPNRRVLFHLKKGDVDGVFIFSHNAQREQIGVYPTKGKKPDQSKHIAQLSYYLYQLKELPTAWTGENFADQQIVVGALAGYAIVSELIRQGIDVQEFNSKEQLYKMLVSGRIDAVAAQDFTFDPFLKNQHKKQVIKLAHPLMSKSYYLIFSHQFYQQHPQIAEQLWSEVVKVRKSRFDIN